MSLLEILVEKYKLGEQFEYHRGKADAYYQASRAIEELTPKQKVELLRLSNVARDQARTYLDKAIALSEENTDENN